MEDQSKSMEVSNPPKNPFSLARYLKIPSYFASRGAQQEKIDYGNRVMPVISNQPSSLDSIESSMRGLYTENERGTLAGDYVGQPQRVNLKKFTNADLKSEMSKQDAEGEAEYIKLMREELNNPTPYVSTKKPKETKKEMRARERKLKTTSAFNLPYDPTSNDIYKNEKTTIF